MRIGEARCLMNLMMKISFASSALLSDVLRYRGDWPRVAIVLWMATRILKRNSQVCWFAGWLGLDCPCFTPYFTVQVLNSVVMFSFCNEVPSRVDHTASLFVRFFSFGCKNRIVITDFTDFQNTGWPTSRPTCPQR